MTDVLRLARTRREELTSELAGLDDFVRMAEELLRTALDRTSARDRDSAPKVDPFQARFNSGEVLPPLADADQGWVPAGAGSVHFVRSDKG